MSDCNHKWMVHHITRIPICLMCDEEMNAPETERRLRATECLSAEDADYLCKYIPHEFVLQENKDKLNAYARALEGKND